MRGDLPHGLRSADGYAAQADSSSKAALSFRYRRQKDGYSQTLRENTLRQSERYHQKYPVILQAIPLFPLIIPNKRSKTSFSKLDLKLEA